MAWPGGRLALMGVTRDEVRLGFLLLFDREPESEEAYLAHMGLPDVHALRAVLMSSAEGQGVFRAAVADAEARFGEHPADSYERRAVCHIHIEKTGGTSFFRMLAPHFEATRRSSTHVGNIFGMSLRELSRYDLLSGHFDYFSSGLIPRRSVQRVCLFREPGQRLISFYRFHRAHPHEHRATNFFVDLAHAHTPEEFFALPAVVGSPRLNNVYLRTFDAGRYEPLEPGTVQTDIAQDVLDAACDRVRRLDAVGVTERAASFQQIFEALALPLPSTIDVVHRTDDLARVRPGFATVPSIDMTPRLRDALRPLVRYDQVLYDVAVAELDRRSQRSC